MTSSMAIGEAKKKGAISNQSAKVIDSVPNMGWRKGKYTTTNTSRNDAPTAQFIHLFEKTPMEKRL